MTRDPSRRLRIALLAMDEGVWGLTTWKRALPVLQTEHEVVGIYLFPERLARWTGPEIPRWYLRVFGLRSFLLLGLFAVRRHISTWVSSVRSWRQLAERCNVPLLRAATPNDDEVVAWVRKNDVDVIIIMVGNILKEPILRAARIGVINKHAAILPACRGLFPFFWASLKGVPTGITFHEVDAGVDTGRVLLQVTYPPPGSSMSMLRFYMDVFAMYPALVNEAVRRLAEGRFPAPASDLAPSSFGLPTRDDFNAFQAKGFRICRFSDLFHVPRSNTAEGLNGVRGN